MTDNVAAHSSMEYDNKIFGTIPLYDMFNKITIDLIQNSDISVSKWLDTGCGTGNLIMAAKELFPETEFVLADPSNAMLTVAKDKIGMDNSISFDNTSSQDLQYDDNTFDVITAIQSHHYLKEEDRVQAVKNCYRMLKPAGILIVFENIKPLSEQGMKIGLKRWGNYQVYHGKTIMKARKHIERFGKEYFPISIIQHLNLLQAVGFRGVEILWASYMQAGFTV